MPSNSEFTLRVLIGGVPIPEYERDGHCYVECNLDTPFTYKDTMTGTVQGDTETQECPVTPYQISVTSRPTSATTNYFRVLVDGVKVKGVSLRPGETRIVKGFRDGPLVRELLFSMPRFATDSNDRVATERVTSIGKIVVECWFAVQAKSRREYRSKHLDFQQANKKDSTLVTNGEYVMGTSKAGKLLSTKSYMRLVDCWKLVSPISSLSVQYHMGHTLQGMGFTLRPLELGAAVKLEEEDNKSKKRRRRRRRGRKRRHADTGPSDPQSRRRQKVNTGVKIETPASLPDAQAPQTTSMPPSQRSPAFDAHDDIYLLEVRPAPLKVSRKHAEPVLIDLTECGTPAISYPPLPDVDVKSETAPSTLL